MSTSKTSPVNIYSQVSMSTTDNLRNNTYGVDDVDSANEISDIDSVDVSSAFADTSRNVKKDPPHAIDKSNDDEDEVVDENIKDETMELMKKNYSHPETSDPNIQYKMYTKREYYYNKVPKRPEISDNTEYPVIK